MVKEGLVVHFCRTVDEVVARLLPPLPEVSAAPHDIGQEELAVGWEQAPIVPLRSIGGIPVVESDERPDERRA